MNCIFVSSTTVLETTGLFIKFEDHTKKNIAICLFWFHIFGDGVLADGTGGTPIAEMRDTQRQDTVNVPERKYLQRKKHLFKAKEA